MKNLERFAASAKASGCPRDLSRNLMRAGVALQEKQMLASAYARACDSPTGPSFVAFGGARGGGKSYWLLAQMGVDDCQRVAGLKCLLLRKVGKANKEHFEDMRQRLFRNLPHKFSPAKGILNFSNGSRIITGHFQNEKDIDAYLGLEYDVIGVEEATTLTERKFTDITTCCRTSKPKWRPRIYCTANPGGIGHNWFKERFVNPFRLGQEQETKFLPATVRDNTFTNPEYTQTLSRLTGWQKKAWLLGDWDIAAGQFFTTFQRDIHVVKHFDSSSATQWWAAMDYGFSHYTVVLLGCKSSDNKIYIVDEHAQRRWLPDSHSNGIQEMLRRHNLRLHNLHRFVAGADVFSRQADGSTIAKSYLHCGINLSRANMDRINGWAEILRKLGDPSNNIEPKLFFHERCAKLISSLPALQHDPSRPEDVLKWDTDEEGRGGDDAADALRYFVQAGSTSSRLQRMKGF